MTPAPTSEPLASIKLLVVDDDVMLTRMIARILCKARVEIEHDPTHALARVVGGETFDVIVCDVQMPKMSGHELLGTLVKHYAGQPRPVLILMTGGDTLVELDASVDAVIIKPFATQELRALVAMLVANRGPCSAGVS